MVANLKPDTKKLALAINNAALREWLIALAKQERRALGAQAEIILIAEMRRQQAESKP